MFKSPKEKAAIQARWDYRREWREERYEQRRIQDAQAMAEDMAYEEWKDRQIENNS